MRFVTLRRALRRGLAPWLAFATALVTLLVATSAFAQTVTINTGTIQRETKNGATVAPRFVIDGKTPGLSQQDCLDDLVYDFPLVITGLPTQYSLQAWAGTNCTDATTRTGSNPTCWPLLASNISPAAAVNVRIRMQDIVGQMTTQPKVLTYSAAGSSTCTSQTTLGPGRTVVNVYFLWVNGSDSSSQGTGATYAVTAKLFGPEAPTNLQASAGGGILKLTWTAPTNQSDLLGYRIYTQASGGEGGVTDATTTVCDEGGTIDGGLDDSGDVISIPVDASCTTTPAAGSCGAIDTTKVTPTEVGGVTGAGTVTGLTDGQSYSVAVAGYDSFGNSGTLSNVVCASPQDTTDFWDNYRNSGGTAGGGYCNTTPSTGSNGANAPWAFFAIGGFAAASLVRRLRRKG